MTEMSYCLKCKAITDSKDISSAISKNERLYKTDTCVKCNSKKSQFMKSVSGGDIQKFLSNVPFSTTGNPFEKHLPGHSFTGPSTRLDLRLDENNNPKDWSMPVNRIDQAAYVHDLSYRTAGDNLEGKHIADRIMIDQLNAITDPTTRERIERLIVKGAIKTKLFFGVGLAEELHKSYRKPPTYLKVKVFAKDDIWSADLVEMPHESLGRSGKCKYILTLIDLFNSYAWAIHLKNKTVSTVKDAFEYIFNTSKRMPKKLWTDRGGEFFAK